jgi:hypothetical protein
MEQTGLAVAGVFTVTLADAGFPLTPLALLPVTEKLVLAVRVVVQVDVVLPTQPVPVQV